MRNGRSLGDFVQLDLVAERIEHVRATPPGDRIGIFETRTGGAEFRDSGIQIIDAQGEMSPRVEA